VLVIAHNADFDRRFLEKRVPVFAEKHWACSRFDIDWKAEGIRSSALEFVAYALRFFHDGHRAASDCRATLHALAQPLPCTGRLALQALLVQARLPTWRLWARDAAIEKKGCPQGARLRLESRRVRATEMLVSRCGGRR
jgi:DNA polymerase-3 subunit epsilon